MPCCLPSPPPIGQGVAAPRCRRARRRRDSRLRARLPAPRRRRRGGRRCCCGGLLCCCGRAAAVCDPRAAGASQAGPPVWTLAPRTPSPLPLQTRKGARQNVAVGLLGEGLAEVAKGRREDEDACAAFATLAAADEAARAAKKGLHAGKDAPVHRIADLCGDAAKAKAHFPSLQVRPGAAAAASTEGLPGHHLFSPPPILLRQRARAPLRGIVEHIFAANRVKLLLPTENCRCGGPRVGPTPAVSGCCGDADPPPLLPSPAASSSASLPSGRPRLRGRLPRAPTGRCAL